MDRRARPLLVLALVACGGEGSAPSVIRPAVACDPVPSLLWPLAGAEGVDWVVNNHVDRDPTRGLLDAWGTRGPLARTVDGHAGLDISVSSFRIMDRGIPVRAVASGVVATVTDGHPDRSTTCDGSPWNLIEIRLPTGHLTRYGHLATDSATVAVGDSVRQGQIIAALGSSGCSDEPHLHLELRHCDGSILAPLAEGRFVPPPAREPSSSVLETFLFSAHTLNNDLDRIKRAGPDLESLPLGSRFTVALAVGNVDPEDRVTLRLFDPAGRLVHDLAHQMTERHEISYWYWNLTATPPVGTWTAQLGIAGLPAPVSRTFEVVERRQR